MPNSVKCQRAKLRSWKHTLEWLEVRLDVGCDKRLVYEYRIEPLKCDRDALKQECRLTRIIYSSTQPPTHLSEKIQRARSYCPRVSSAIGTKRKLWGKQNAWSPSERRQVLWRQQQNDLRHGGKTEQAYWPLWCPMSRACPLAKGLESGYQDTCHPVWSGR